MDQKEEKEDRNVQTPQWFVGELDHTWSWNEDGRMEVKCRVVVDVATQKLVAAQVWGYESWYDAASAQRDDLARTLFVVNRLSDEFCGFDFFGIDRLPRWAAGAAGLAQLPPYEDDEVIGLDRIGDVVHWRSGADMPVSSGESLKAFGLHNLREHELARVGVTREAWEAAVARQAGVVNDPPVLADADVRPAHAEAARQFMTELLDSVETLSGIVETHGARTLADLMYLQNAILNGSFIDHYPGESSVRELVTALPSADRWMKHVALQEPEDPERAPSPGL